MLTMLDIVTILIVALKVIGGFSLLILIHELGHFLIAKRNGVWVEEFGLGLPPRLLKKKIGETIYSLNLLPIGGFVKLHGETTEDGVTKPDRAFINKSKKVRIAVTLAGIIMNFLLAIACFSLVYSVQGIPTDRVDVKIINVSPDSPAGRGGMLSGDVVKKVADQEVTTTQDFQNKVDQYKDKRVVVEVERNSEIVKLTLTPRGSPPEGEGPLGVVIADAPQIYFPPIWQRPFVAAVYGTKHAIEATGAVFGGLGSTAREVSQGQAPKSLTGVVGIFAIFIYFAELGMLDLVNLIGVISINLAVINLIPFPPLDGSRVASTIIEGLFGKKLKPKWEEKMNLIGFGLLILLMVLITAREIPKLIQSGSINNFVENLINGK